MGVNSQGVQELSLAFSEEAGRILVILNGNDGLLRHGWAPVRIQDLAELAARANPGDQMAAAILPANIRQSIANFKTGRLNLQFSRALVDFPFEQIVDHAGPWQARFSIVRTLTDLERSGAKNVSSQPNPQDSRLVINLILDGAQLSERQAWNDALASININITAESNDASIIISANSELALARFNQAEPTRPVVWIWPETGEDTNAIAALTGAGHAVLSLSAALSKLHLRQACLPLLNACTQGQSIPDAIRKAAETDPIPGAHWRAYDVPYRSLAPSNEASPKPTQGENRQVTALSLDLAGSTSLILALGSEGYSEMLSKLHQICVTCAESRGGVQYGRLGDDSSMIVFGIPRALEDSANRAMATALEMQHALAGLPGSPKLRIGIATGRVSVHQDVPYGETVHLAARLQSLGRPGEVIVDDTSRLLSQHDFVFRSEADYQAVDSDLGQLSGATLVGAREPEHPLPSSAALSPFVAREAELADINSYWHRSRTGEVITLTIRGEAGIGKTRLIREFLQTLDRDSRIVFLLRGLPDFQRSPFRSLIDALERGFHIHARQRQGLSGNAAEFPAPAIAAMMQLRALLGVDQPPVKHAGVPSATKKSGEKLRAGIFDAIHRVTHTCALIRPLVIVIEDLQWVDHSTLEALQVLIERVRTEPSLPILFLASVRECTLLTELPQTNVLEIEKLSHTASRWLVREIGGEKLSAPTIDRLAQRANGNPLFLEESAKIAMDIHRGPEEWQTTVPESLDALLMTRLDHAGQDAKSLAQVISVLGRSVPIALLQAVSKDPALPVTVGRFSNTLAALESSGIVYKSMTAGSIQLSFKHELLRDVAYSSMWVRDRNRIHALTVSYLENTFSYLVRRQPDTLAYHYRASGQYAQAAHQWEQAATMAAETSANLEAIDHLKAAIDSQNQVEPSIDTERAEMRLQLKLAARLIASEGYGAAPVEHLYVRAEELARRLQDSPATLKAQLGLESVLVMRGKLTLATSLARNALEIAISMVRAGANPVTLMQARWALANVLFHSGQSEQAMLLFERCLAEYREEMHQPQAVQDPGVMCLCYSAWALWEMGYADQAKTRVEQVVSLATRLKHKFSQAQAHGFAASISLFRGEQNSGLCHAEKSLQISEESGFSVWFAHATVIRGRLRALSNSTDNSIDEMSEGYQLWSSTGAVITCPFYLALIAETQLEREQLEAARSSVEKALQIIDKTGENYHKAELLRLYGQIAYATGNTAKGDSLICEAISLANEQNKPAFALRASIIACKQLNEKGHHRQAELTITQALSRFTEGLATADLVGAKQLKRICETHVSSPNKKDRSERHF